MIKTYQPLRLAAPFLILALCVLCVFIPPLYLAMPVVAIWIDGRTGGIGASLSMTVVLGLLFWMLLGVPGVLASLCFSVPALTARVLHKRGAPFDKGWLPMLAGTTLAMAAFLVSLFAVVGGDLIRSWMDLLRDLLMQLPQGPLDDVLPILASSMAVAQDPSLASKAADLHSTFSAMPRVEVLNELLPYVDAGLRITLPSALLCGILVLGGISWLMGGYLVRGARKKGRPVPEWLREESLPQDFRGFGLPGWITTPLLLMLLATFLLQLVNESLFLVPAYTAQKVVDLVLKVQGMAVIAWWGDRKHMPLAGRIALIVLGYIILGGEILLLLGAADALFHIRRFVHLREALLRQQHNHEKQEDEEDQKK